MRKTPDYRGIAKVFQSGRSQVVRLPTACRFDVSEVEVIKEGDQLTLRPRGKNWSAWFESDSRGSLPTRHDPLLDTRMNCADLHVGYGQLAYRAEGLSSIPPFPAASLLAH